MTYRLNHTSTYKYTEAVSISHHLVRLTPRALPHQTCRRCEITITPAPQTTSQRTDYFGNTATFVIVQGLHEELIVKAQSEVEVSPVSPVAPSETPPWENVRDALRSDLRPEVLRACEFALDSPYAHSNPDLAAYAAPSFPAGRPLLEAVLDLTQRINHEFSFDPKATTLATPLEEVFAKRRGVCQDFAHLEIGC